MLKHRLTLLFVITSFIVGASLSAVAAEAVHATIPFDFVVQGVTYPAGVYRIVSTSTSRVVIVRNEENLKQSFMILLPTGESLLDGNVRLLLQPKSPAPVRAGLQSSRK